MPDLSSRHGRGIRLAAVIGVVAVLLAGLGTILLFPAAFVAAATGVAGIRLVNTEGDDAALRFGVSVIASGLVAVFTFATAQPFLIGLGLVAAVSFTLAWHWMRALRDDRRRTWAVDHQERWQRLQQLHAHRDAMPPAPDEDAAAVDDDAEEWWQDLD